MAWYVNANTTERQCTVAVNTNSGTPSLNNASIGYAVLGNVSDTHSLVTTASGFMLPVPVGIPSDLDYTASSFAVKTTCKPLTSACQASFQGDFDCRTAGYDFAGQFEYEVGSGALFSHSLFKLQFTDPTLSGGVNCTGWNCWNQTNTALKGHFALASTIDFDFEKWIDIEQAIDLSGGTSTYFVLGCDYYAYEVAYSMVEGAIASIRTSPLNLTAFSTLNMPLQAGLGDDYIKSQLTSLVARASSVSDIADGFGRLFSQAFLGLSAGALDERNVTAQQTRHDFLVAKIPKALLWLNVALPFAFALLGMFILMWASLSHGGEGEHAVKERMSLAGLVAQSYIPTSAESPQAVDDLFKESERSGAYHKIVASRGRHGTWELKSSHALHDDVPFGHERS